MYPSFNQFGRWAAQYRAIPIWIEPELPARDLLEWAHSLAGAQSKFFFLHSASSGAGRQSRYSYISMDSPRYSAHVEDGALIVRSHSASQEALKIGNPFERFHDWLSSFSAPRVEALPPFWGGAVGYFGYESARYLDPKLARLFPSKKGPDEPLAMENFHDFEFGIFDAVAVVDHARRRLWIVHTVLLPEHRVFSPAQLERLYRQAQDRLRRDAVRLQKAIRHKRAWGTFEARDVRSNRSEAAYRLMVRRAKGLIAAGDIYQCNISQSFNASWQGDPWALYQRLTDINPSPYAALWRSGTRWMVSASPELLVRQEGERIETRPIAGTYPRTPGAFEDRQVLQDLVRDAKERAEHIMLVDLERNDLSRVCASPTVQVAEALMMEIYSHVVHLVSDIRGRLRPGQHWQDAVRAVYPGGTITGCPKLRAMEVIQKLESHRRGPYTGSLGWIGFTGDMALNILIRTFFLDKGRLSFPAGAGIVADSDPEREYQETVHKAQALMQALKEPSALKFIPRRTL